MVFRLCIFGDRRFLFQSPYAEHTYAAWAERVPVGTCDGVRANFLGVKGRISAALIESSVAIFGGFWNVVGSGVTR